MAAIFKDPDKLQELLLLRSQGWSTTALAVHFRTYDHHAIIYHLKKFGMQGRIPLTVWLYQEPRLSVYIIKDISEIAASRLADHEPKNEGRTYSEYLKAQKNRHARHRIILAP